MEAKDCRLILTTTTECLNGCKGCYYSWRETRQTNSSRKITDIELFKDFDKFAIGINRYRDYIYEELTLASELIISGKDVVLTTSNNDLTSIVTILSGAGFRFPSALCISLHPPVNDCVDVSYLSRIDVPLFINITDTNANRLSNVKGIPDNVIIYLLMEKGPTRLDGNGWKMTDRRIDKYIRRYFKLRNAIGNTIRLDECVSSIMEGGRGNCGGKWLEIDSVWRARACAYSIDSVDIGDVIDYGIPLLECNEPLCR